MTAVTFSRDLLADLLSTTRVKDKGGAASANTPTYVTTVMQTFSAVFEHHSGIADADDFRDLLWCTLSTLKQPSITTNKRPLFPESVNRNAAQAKQIPVAESTLKKNIENCRSVLFAAKKYLQTTEMGDCQQIIAQYDAAFDEFGTLCDVLGVKQLQVKLSGDKSARQEKNWRDWSELKEIEKTVVLPYVEAALSGNNDDLNEHSIEETKKLQTYIAYLMYTMIPPVRSNYSHLRFVSGSNATKLRVELKQSPNYILVPDAGPMEIVLNRFKNDQRTSAGDYDGKDCDFQLDHSRTRRLVLEDNEILQQYGFDPKKLGVILGQYHMLGLFKNRNPDGLVFFDVEKKKKGVPATPVKRLHEGGVKDRLSTLSKKLTKTDAQPGVRIACQLFRTIFDTYLNTQEPAAADRLYIAELMCHECSTQMITYTKNSKAGHKRRHSSGEPKSKRARPVSQSESDDEDVVVPERRSSTRRAMAASLA